MSNEHMAALERRRLQVDAFGEVYESVPKHSHADEGSGGKHMQMHADASQLEHVPMAIMMIRDVSDSEEDTYKRIKAVATPFRQRTRNPIMRQWSCTTCTLDNEASTHICQACGNQRLQKPVAPSSGHQAQDMWICSVCMLENAHSVAKCEACHTNQPSKKDAQTKIFQTVATLPMDIDFTLPQNFVQGQEFADVKGPHGLVRLRVPEGSWPGSLVTVRLGPNNVYKVTLPGRVKEGDTLTVEPPVGETIQFHVPPGKKAGDQFKIEPQVLMVRVPEGTKRKDWVKFTAPNGIERMARVPRGVPPGQYFDVPLDRVVI